MELLTDSICSNLKVLYAASALNRGLVFHFTHLALSLKKKLPDLVVVSGPEEEEAGLFNQLKHEEVSVYVNSCIDKLSLKNLLRGVFFFRHLIVHEDLDIIHVQTLYSLIMAFISSKLVRGKKVKILVTIHSTMHGTSYERLSLKFGGFILSLCADLVIPVSDDAAKKLIESNLDQRKIAVIPNGIDLEIFDNMLNTQKITLELPYSFKDQSSIVISYFATLVPRKGHSYLITAFSELLKDFPNLKLILTSDGPLKTELVALTKTLGVSNYVYFAGRVSYEKLLEILKRTDFYVFPSLSELFPFAILEAMAANKPVIATDVGDVSKVIIDGNTGILVPSGSSKSLYIAIKELLENPLKAKELGNHARSLVEELFNINTIASTLVTCYYAVK